VIRSSVFFLGLLAAVPSTAGMRAGQKVMPNVVAVDIP
jgi:hypothetical protein